MTTLTARLVEDQPAMSHPGWCLMTHGDNNSHAGPYNLAENIGVVVVQGEKRPMVWIARRAYLPEDARAIAGLLSVLGHAVLAATVTWAVEMSES